MTLNALCKALGAKDESEALTVVAEANQFLSSVKGALGKSTFAECLSEIQALVAIAPLAPLATRILNETGTKSNDEALGTVQAWKASHGKLPTVEKELTETQATAAATALDKLLDDGRSGAMFEDNKPRLTKAMADDLRKRVEAHNKAKSENRTPTEEDWSLSQARAYVKALPPQAQLAASVNPTAPQNAPTTVNTAPAPGVPVHNGKSYEQLTNVERHNLSSENESLFTSMRNDWERRGCPMNEA
jgi:hypothetical protein